MPIAESPTGALSFVAPRGHTNIGVPRISTELPADAILPASKSTARPSVNVIGCWSTTLTVHFSKPRFGVRCPDAAFVMRIAVDSATIGPPNAQVVTIAPLTVTSAAAHRPGDGRAPARSVIAHN